MKTCEKMIKRGAMTEARKCLRRVGHSGKCSPDLTGMKFGLNTVQKLTSRHKHRHGTHTRWIVEQRGDTKPVLAYALINGINKGKNWKSGYSSAGGGKTRPEYRTMQNHYHRIAHPNNQKSWQVYAGMPFHPEWDPREGGALWKGAKWIIDTLGERPSPKWTLDIVEHGKGFVPGNLRWALHRTQTENQRHKHLGKFTLPELKTEAKRRGYILKKIQG